MSVTEIDDDYTNLSGSFARAGRVADRAYNKPPASKRAVTAATSTLQAAAWLARYCEPERLQKFLEGRPKAEIVRIHLYISRSYS